MPLSNDALIEIVKHSADADIPLSKGVLRELAEAAGMNPDEVVAAHDMRRADAEEGVPMPSMERTPWNPDWRR